MQFVFQNSVQLLTRRQRTLLWQAVNKRNTAERIKHSTINYTCISCTYNTKLLVKRVLSLRKQKACGVVKAKAGYMKQNYKDNRKRFSVNWKRKVIFSVLLSALT